MTNARRLTEEATVGEGCELVDCSLGAWTEIGEHNHFENVDFGDFSYTGPWCIAQNAIIGKFSNIAAMVRIGPTDHPMDRPSLHHFTYRRALYGFGQDDGDFFAARKARVTRIGHDTWIGHGAIIMPGVNVGDGAVIGSGAVVTKDLPAYCVAVGVPAKPIRRRFAEREADALARIAWWDWDHGTIQSRARDFLLPVEKFIERYRIAGDRG
jgi:phosphonate metabolism protein (transferase hexapeptide repeat family)